MNEIVKMIDNIIIDHKQAISQEKIYFLKKIESKIDAFKR